MKLDDNFYKAMIANDNSNYKKAFYLYMRTVRDGNSSAMCAIANMYSESMCLPNNLQKSIEWEVQGIAYAPNNERKASSINSLAVTYRFLGDLKAYKYFLEKSLLLGEDDSALELARLYNISDKENEKVRQLLLTVVESEMALLISQEEAELLLNSLPSQPANNRSIPEYFLMSVENKRLNPQKNDLTIAINSVDDKHGLVDKVINAEYQHAIGAYTKAFKQFSQLAKQWKSTIAMNYLGLMYRQGQGIEQSYDISIEWYQQAIEHGHEESLIDLANVYRDIRQIDQYKYYLEEACKLGNGKAMLLLAKLYNVSDKETEYIVKLVKALLESNVATVDIIYEAEKLLDSVQ